MERLDEDLFARSSLRKEHYHRYELASRVARGCVVDCACGIGYGSAILLNNPVVTDYTGIDPEEEAIAYATEKFSGRAVKFISGTLEQNTCAPDSVDTFTMFETLEHTTNPRLALKAVAQSLKSGGLLIGSVPSADYEMICERVYGPNPYHLQKFSVEDLRTLLEGNFQTVNLFAAEYLLGTLVRPLGISDAEDCGEVRLDPKLSSGMVKGSILFMAGDRERVAEARELFGKPRKFLIGLAKAELDEEELRPTQEAFQNAEKMVDDRDKAIHSQAEVLEARWEMLQDAEKHRQQLVTELETSSERLNVMERVLNGSLKSLIGNSQSILSPAGRSDGVFTDLACSLYVFIERLFGEVVDARVHDLFFLAREGQVLKQMFDFYQTIHPDTHVVRTHYIKVSRRSTFLMSLGELEDEQFLTLFRQYRDISLAEFIKSLDLDRYLPIFRDALGESDEFLEAKVENLPESGEFKRLVELPEFKSIYDDERLERREAFRHYLSGYFSKGELPSSLHVVDVGWKGTIQDNLFNWWKQEQGRQSASMVGYYVGMMGAGVAAPTNIKHGLLFSNLEGFTPGFAIFAENRSLYEILLHADHGSARRYVLDEEKRPLVIEDEYAEGEMIERLVRPVSREVISYFNELVVIFNAVSLSPSQKLDFACTRHARMVFRPDPDELSWVSKVSHVENFGVFEESDFSTRSRIAFSEKLLLTLNLLRRKRHLDLGFWPWLSLQNRALPGIHSMYRWIRIRQGMKR